MSDMKRKILKAFKDEGGALGEKALRKHIPEGGYKPTLKELMKKKIITRHPDGDLIKEAKIATKTDPAKWEKAKADAKARMGGKHSARAMQLATQLYKKRGGGYSGAKPSAKTNSLKKWGKQKWQWSKEKKSSVTAKTLRSLKNKPDEFADLVNRLYRSKGVAPGAMHTRQFLNKGGKVSDEQVESVIRSLRAIDNEPKRDLVPFGSDLHKQIAKDIKAGRMTKLETGTTDRGLKGIQRYGISGPIGEIRGEGPSKALAGRYTKFKKDAFEEGGYEGLAKQQKERKITQGIFANPRGTERTRDYGPAKMEFELPASLAENQRKLEYKVPRQIMQRFGKNIKMTDSGGNVLPVRRPFAKIASEGKGVYLPAAKIKRLKSSDEGKAKLRAAERKKAIATSRGEQYSSHGLAAGTSLKKTAMDKRVLKKIISQLRKSTVMHKAQADKLEKIVKTAAVPYIAHKPTVRDKLDIIAHGFQHPIHALKLFSDMATKRRRRDAHLKNPFIRNDARMGILEPIDLESVKFTMRNRGLLLAGPTTYATAGVGGTAYGIKKYKESKKKSMKKVAEQKRDPRLVAAGVKGYNMPRLTPNHPKKKGIVVAKEGDRIKTIRFGAQGYKHNYSKEGRQRFKTRHASNIARGKMSAAYWADKLLWAGPKGHKQTKETRRKGNH